MRIIIAVLSFAFLCVGNAETGLPCLAASQARIFPLGTTDKGLIVMETHFGRGENFMEGDNDEMKPYWRGICYLKVYDKNHKEISSQVLDTLKQFKQEEY